MLTKCPECELQVSDRAISCPHCGYPITKNKPRLRKTTKRMRLPNGFGQIYEEKGKNLRKPFRASVTIGKTPEGRPIVKALKPVSSFKTYNEAYEALVEYNKAPYDLETSMTVKELYEKWFSYYSKKLKSKSSERTITSAWKHCSCIYNIRVQDLRAKHIKFIMDQKTSPNIKSRIKSLFNLMLDYAVEFELVERNVSRTFNLSKDIVENIENKKKDHIPFTDEEMSILWQHTNIDIVKLILIQCYSGWRPQELCKLEKRNINISEGIMIGGMKTDAGFDRTVPIHPAIKGFIEEKYNSCTGKYLFGDLTYDKFRYRFNRLIKSLNLNIEHRPHDGRKHFVTLAKKCKVDEYAIKYIVGHKINDITEKIYTQRGDKWLISEMKKIKGPA